MESKPQALTGAQVRHAALLRWWDRIGIGVRCAYNPACPCALRHYLEAGRRVAAAGAYAEQQVLRRTLTVLLQTARDEALPWYWRSVCLESTARPLARLRHLGAAVVGASGALAWQAQVDTAHEALAGAGAAGAGPV